MANSIITSATATETNLVVSILGTVVTGFTQSGNHTVSLQIQEALFSSTLTVLGDIRISLTSDDVSQ